MKRSIYNENLNYNYDNDISDSGNERVWLEMVQRKEKGTNRLNVKEIQVYDQKERKD